MLPCRLLPGTEVSLVIQVHSIGNAVKTVTGAEALHHREQFVLTVETARPIILNVFRSLQFCGGNDFHGNALLGCEGKCVLQVSAGQTG